MVCPLPGDPRRPGEQPANSRMKPPALRAAAYPPRYAAPAGGGTEVTGP